MILWDKLGEIKYIVEVENDPVRKVIVGASILADYSVAELQQTTSRLIFVVYSEKGIKQIHNFIKKLDIAKKYCPHLENIEIYSEADFKKLSL